MRTTISILLFLFPFNLYASSEEFIKAIEYYDSHDYKRAYKLFKEEAKNEDVDSQVMLGVMYDNGLGVLINHKQAMKWFNRAVTHGNAEAMYALGTLYMSGRGDIIDVNKAIKFYKKSVELGSILPYFNLGLYYEKIGESDEAIIWYTKAIEVGVLDAAYNLGQIYRYGDIITKRNLRLAKRWFHIGAEENHHESQKSLSIIYKQENDLEQSIYWLKRTVQTGNIENGVIKDIYYLEQLENELKKEGDL